jgi:hypothetical protein
MFAGSLLAFPAFAQSEYARPYSFETFAGIAPGSSDGNGPNARFNGPVAVAVDGSGNLFVADNGNNTVRMITSGGMVSTLAGTAGQSGSSDGTGSAARFNNPNGVAVDSSENIYVADTGNDTIRKITPDGNVSTFAGQAGQSGSADGSGTAALFNGPKGVAVDASGNVYVADTGNCTIREITPSGVVSTIVGLTSPGEFPGVPGGLPQFGKPVGIAVDASGNIFVADVSANAICEVSPTTVDGTTTWVLTTIAGLWSRTEGSADGTGRAASFYEPSGVSVDGADNVYVADTGNDTIRKITAAGEVTTMAGVARQFGSADGTGAVARFRIPTGIVVDSLGNVYVADTANDEIRSVAPSSAVATLAGGNGNAGRFYQPWGVATDNVGNVYVADLLDSTICKITPTGAVSTLAGTSGQSGDVDGTGASAQFSAPRGVAVDGSGNIFVSDMGDDTIRMISPTGSVTTLAGSEGQSGGRDGTGAGAQFSSLAGLAVDGAGNVYVADNDAIRKVTPEGVVTTLAGIWNTAGNDDGTGSTARFNFPQGVAVDEAGNVFVADSYNSEIRKITPTGVVTTIAGGQWGSADGVGIAAQFALPNGIAVDGADNIYIADTQNDTIRMITAAGMVSTLAGTPGQSGSSDGTGGNAAFDYPTSVAVDGSGNVFVADSKSNTIRKGYPADGASIANQPQNDLVALGGTADFAVAAIGSPILTYQWQVSADGGLDWTNMSDGGGISGSTSPTMSIVDASDELNGNLYQCVVTNSLNSVTTNFAVLTVGSAPLITNQPVSESVAAGSGASFAVVAGGTPVLTYQWEVSTDGGAIFDDLSDKIGVSGSESPTLSINGIGIGLNGNQYECVIANGIGSVTSVPVVLTVETPPSITTQPVPQTVNAGSSVVLAVVASGSSALSYQWNLNGNPISGATGPTLSLSNVTAASGGTYSVDVTDGSGNETTSANAALTVSSVTSSPISTQPMSQTIAMGSTVVFTVGANGSVQTSSVASAAGRTAKLSSGTTYQWQFNGANFADGNGISGSAGPQLVIQGAGAANTGDYDCIVTTGGVAAQSNSASLMVGSVSNPGYLINLSARGFVGTGNGILIGGFYIVGSTSRTVLVQALGPALSAEGVSGALQHPALTIHNAAGATIYSNTGWGSSQLLLNAAAAAYANPVLLANSGDSEVLLTLPPGGYTAEIAGADGGTGVALCAIYQLP